MKRCIIVAIWLCSSLVIFAQFDPQIAHYMFFNGIFNPAAIGDGNLMKVTGSHRIQWVGIPNAPQTTFFHFQSPFVLGKTRHGAGVRFLNDKGGLFSNQSAHVQYSFKYPLGKGYLSAGADLGFISCGFSGDSVRDITSDYHDIQGDQQIPTSEEAGMSFDMSLGIYYSATAWYAGISYAHLNKPRIEWGEYAEYSVNGTLYILGGYNWILPNPNYKILPSAIVYTDFVSWQCNISALLEYKNKYRGGLQMRVQDAVGIILGMDVISGLSIGYAYELPTSKILSGSSGTHEVFLSYGFDILKQKRNSKYKSIRIL